MPQDTTIYWDGKGQAPPIIDSLPLYQRQLVLQAVEQKSWESYTQHTFVYLFLCLGFIFFSILALYSNKVTKRRERESQSAIDHDLNLYSEGATSNRVFTYAGNTLNFTANILMAILLKHLPYFTALNPFDRDRFIHRLQNFIAHKTFVIHDESGFKEMPVLISATAIQLTFGLEKYLLPNFNVIHIFPEEFIGVHPTIRILEGNVSGNTINLSWKHFLQGFQFPGDGQNVGLHEMAHAYYFQYFETKEQVDTSFVAAFPAFNDYGNKVFQQEGKGGFILYSGYALSNFQEFWAESVELFFEKPAAMKIQYPELYLTMCHLLNQDPMLV